MAENPAEKFPQQDVDSQPALIRPEGKLQGRHAAEEAVKDILDGDAPALLRQQQAQKTKQVIEQAQPRSHAHGQQKALALVADGDFHV